MLEPDAVTLLKTLFLTHHGVDCTDATCHSSFQSTDLDFQLHQREITHVVLAGLTTNTCLEATARYAYELGYHVTML